MRTMTILLIVLATLTLVQSARLWRSSRRLKRLRLEVKIAEVRYERSQHKLDRAIKDLMVAHACGELSDAELVELHREHPGLILVTMTPKLLALKEGE